jgi:uncharacterized protein YjbI with pentapeptide repeats
MNKSDNESRRLIHYQYFLTENSLRQCIAWAALARISFVNCNFENVSLNVTVFGSSIFENCTFNQFEARKCKFSNCHFEGCKITNSGMTRAEFYDTHFKNCQFLGVNLQASDFDSCTLETTRFFRSNLGFIGVENVKVWKSKEWVEIEDFSSFQKHLDELNSYIT